jgi:DNA repair protein RadC
LADKNHISIKSWSVDDRPREKMIAKGRHALSDSELLAIILGSGSRGESAVDLSKRILADYQNDLNELGKLSIKDLVKNYKGVGEAKAINILACLELGRRRQQTPTLDKPIIKTSKDSFKILYPLVSDLNQEEFWVLLANRGLRFIRTERIGIGNLHSVIVDARTVVKLALDHQASNIVLCHNHPSGKLAASQADINITNKIRSAVELFDIKIVDHIIIADQNYYSFSDNGLIDP